MENPIEHFAKDLAAVIFAYPYVVAAISLASFTLGSLFRR